MRNSKLFWFLLIGGIFNLSVNSYSQELVYERVWGTYFGDENLRIFNNAIDREGNIYLVGGVQSNAFFPATANSHQPAYGGGVNDGFVVKMNSEGEILWATYYGGERSEYISGVTIGENNNVYITGISSSNENIATPDAYQPYINGVSDYFVVKFSPEGERLWGTYYPSVDGESPNHSLEIGAITYSIVADGLGAIYFVNRTDKPDIATPGTFQTEIGQPGNFLITKFSAAGERLWATYYGIYNSSISSIALGSDGLYLAGNTLECPPQGSYNTYFGTAGSHQPEPDFCKSVYLSKFTFDGQRIWSTYYGGISPGRLEMNAVVCFEDAVYFTSVSPPSTAITTPGSYQESADDVTPFLVKFNSDGERQWGTFLGLNPDMLVNSTSSYAQLEKDKIGNIYMLGTTRLDDNISTSSAFQEERAGSRDAYLAIFSPGGQLLYGTYYGGDDTELTTKPLVYEDFFYIVGHTKSTEGITTEGSYQPDYMTGSNPTMTLKTNIFLAKFAPEGMGIEDFGNENLIVFPNPNNGNFSIMTKDGIISSVEVYNSLGQKVVKSKSTFNSQGAEVADLDSGLYFVKVTLDNYQTETIKVMVE